jgi:hypothetical protein
VADSSSLADLRQLVSSGVAKSEILVILLSKGLLTRSVHHINLVMRITECIARVCCDGRRPWCLLEICEAMRMKKPIILLQLQGPGKEFSFDDAFVLLSNLKATLHELNPPAIVELRTHAKQSLVELQETVRQALEMAQAKGVSHMNVNG